MDADVLGYVCEPEDLAALRRIASRLFDDNRFKTDERRALANRMEVLLNQIAASPLRQTAPEGHQQVSKSIHLALITTALCIGAVWAVAAPDLPTIKPSGEWTSLSPVDEWTSLSPVDDWTTPYAGQAKGE